MPFRGKILVIRGGAIGDFILTLPALTALRRSFPEAYLEVLGYPHIVQLATAGGLVDQARSIDARPMAGFFARHGELAKDLVDYFSEFDLIVSYLYDPDDIFRANVARCSPAQFIVGPHRPDERKPVPAAKVYLEPLERLAIFERDVVPRLSLEHSQPPRPQLAVHPGSGSERKNWPPDNWNQLLQLLVQRTELDLLLVGGEAEGDRLQLLASGIPSQRAHLAQSLPLADLARLLSGCVAFIGHDSGISHLAAAVGLPGLVLWGDTVEVIWRPPSEKFSVLKSASGLAGLPVETVWQHAGELWTTRMA